MTNHKRTTRGREAASTGRVVAYVRISKDRENETSTATQEAAIRAWAEMHGHTIVSVIVEPGKSAHKKHVRRQGLERAMRMVETGAADTLVVWRLDRFMRDAVEFMAHWSRIDAAGGRFASVTESMDTSTALGRLAVMIIATLAEMESEARSERALPWHAHRRGTGMPPTGPVAFGYDRPAPNTLVINEANAAIVREMVDGILVGDSLRQWAKTLNERGVPTRSGKPWNGRAIKWVVTTATIAGMVEHDGVMTDGNWQGIVDVETLALVRDKLNDANRRTSFADTHTVKHVASGIIVCGKCGSVMHSRWQAKDERYQCFTCNGTSIRMAVVHGVINDAVMNIDRDAWNALRMRGRTAAPVVVESIEQEANELAAMFAAGTITLAQFTIMNDALTARVANAVDRDVVELPDVENIHKSWAMLSNDDKRLVIRAMFDSITINANAAGATGRDRVVIVERDHDSEDAAA